MMRGGEMGMRGHMKGGPMMGMCPMKEPGAEIRFEETKHGVSISVTSDDPKTVERIQKKAQIMRLMRELRQDQ